MTSDIEKLFEKGRADQKREAQISQRFKNFGDWIKERQIAIATKDIQLVQTALAEIRGKPVEITINKKRKFPVFIRTGITITEPNYYRRYDSIGYRPERWEYSQDPTSELVVKARGHKILLQGGVDIKDHAFKYGANWQPHDRILARGTKGIIRYLGRFTQG